MISSCPRHAERGAALLAVLWLSAALSAIAFTVATSVRAETERTITDVDALRAGYLADGAIDRALLYIQWGPNYRNPDGTPKYFQSPMPLLSFQFPTGMANVEIIPETAKLNVNQAQPVEIKTLLLLLGVDPARADAVTAAILDWRSPTPDGAFSQFDQHYLSLVPSFQARHASFHEIEELLLVQGVTTDLFYGSYTRDEQGDLLRHPALRDCLSVFGTKGVIDINTAEPAVMGAIGITPDFVNAIVNRRRQGVIKQGDVGALVSGAGPGAARLGIAPSTIVTLRATAALRLANGQLSDLRRSVSAMVKFLGPGFNEPYHVMRWYDNVVAPQ
jgi:general secretion pathway protein K